MARLLTANGTVDHDVRCWSCGYNLRALPSRGQCPECGNTIALSLWLHKSPRPSLDETDAGWLTQLIEGVVLALATWMLVLAFALSPEWLTVFHSPQRAVALGIACAWWTLSWIAVWKLMTPE